MRPWGQAPLFLPASPPHSRPKHEAGREGAFFHPRTHTTPHHRPFSAAARGRAQGSFGPARTSPHGDLCRLRGEESQECPPEPPMGGRGAFVRSPAKRYHRRRCPHLLSGSRRAPPHRSLRSGRARRQPASPGPARPQLSPPSLPSRPRRRFLSRPPHPGNRPVPPRRPGERRGGGGRGVGGALPGSAACQRGQGRPPPPRPRRGAPLPAQGSSSSFLSAHPPSLPPSAGARSLSPDFPFTPPSPLGAALHPSPSPPRLALPGGRGGAGRGYEAGGGGGEPSGSSSSRGGSVGLLPRAGPGLSRCSRRLPGARREPRSRGRGEEEESGGREGGKEGEAGVAAGELGGRGFAPPCVT